MMTSSWFGYTALFLAGSWSHDSCLLQTLSLVHLTTLATSAVVLSFDTNVVGTRNLGIVGSIHWQGMISLFSSALSALGFGCCLQCKGSRLYVARCEGVEQSHGCDSWPGAVKISLDVNSTGSACAGTCRSFIFVLVPDTISDIGLKDEPSRFGSSDL